LREFRIVIRLSPFGKVSEILARQQMVSRTFCSAGLRPVSSFTEVHGDAPYEVHSFEFVVICEVVEFHCFADQDFSVRFLWDIFWFKSGDRYT